MKHISEVIEKILASPWDVPAYIRPRWESPIEEILWDALRYQGLQVETQVSIDRFRADMVVSSQINNTRLVVECDGEKHHFFILDDFRDDIIEDDGWPICRIPGSQIVKNADKCAINIVRLWYPELTNTFGYLETVEELERTRENIGFGVFEPIFYARPDIRGLKDPDRPHRDQVREAFAGRWRNLADLARAFIELTMPRTEDMLNRLYEFLSQQPPPPYKPTYRLD